MTLFIIILVFFLLGLGIQHTLSPSNTLSQRLNLFVINIAFPAVILTTVPTMAINQDIALPLLSYWLTIPLMAWLSRLLCRLFSWGSDVRCVIFVMCICGNTGFLGIPMTQALLGQEVVAYAVLYDQFGTFLGISLVVTLAIATEKHQGESISIKTQCLNVLRFTPFSVLLLSLLLPIAPVIEPIKDILQAIGALIVPATMLIIGLQFSIRLERRYYGPLFTIILLKMSLLPLLVWLVLNNVTNNSSIIAVTVFEAAAAPMVTASVLLIVARIATPLVTSTLGISTLLSFVTLPIWAYILK